MSRQPEPPAWLVAAFWGTRASGDAEYNAAVAWRAVVAHSELHTRIGRAFYDDTDEGQPVLVIPLPVVEPRDTEQA